MTKASKPITLNLHSDRSYSSTEAFTPDDLRLLMEMRQTQGVHRDTILKAFPQLSKQGYAVLTIAKIKSLLAQSKNRKVIWVAYKKV